MLHKTLDQMMVEMMMVEMMMVAPLVEIILMMDF